MGTENTKLKIEATTADGYREKLIWKGNTDIFWTFQFYFQAECCILKYLLSYSLGILDVWNISLKTSQGAQFFHGKEENERSLHA